MDGPIKEVSQPCFVIMPISTRKDQFDLYGGDQEHFAHSLECLFIPAIEQAGFTPIAPASVGGELIHADIVRQLSTAPMVLCDMSGLNSNVFFEFGIRTALDLPVALVVDDVTPKIPFDTGIINYHIFSSQLLSWKIKDEISRLADHIDAVWRRAEGRNALWKYFGVASAATRDPQPGKDEKLDVILVVFSPLLIVAAFG